MSEYKQILINNAHLFNFPIHRPISQLTKKNMMYYGMETNTYGINQFFQWVEENTYKIQVPCFTFSL